MNIFRVEYVLGLLALWSGSNVLGSLTFFSTLLIALFAYFFILELNLLRVRFSMDLLPLFFMIGYFSLVASIVLSEALTLSPSIGPLLKIAFLFCLFYYVSQSISVGFLKFFPGFYSATIFWLTAINIVGALVFYFRPDIGQLNIIGASEREYSIIGLFITSKIDGYSDYLVTDYFYRFQSVFDEPGTYAFFALPALFFYKVKGSYLHFIVVLLGIVLSLSAGAWFLALGMFILFGRTIYWRFFFLFMFCFLLASIWFTYDDFLISRILIEKFVFPDHADSTTSLGQRINELSFIRDLLEWNFFLGRGLGAGENPISVRYIYVVYAGGIGALLGLCLCVVSSLLMSIHLSNGSSAALIFYSYLGGMVILSGFQRMMFIDLIQFVILLAFVVAAFHLREVLHE